MFFFDFQIECLIPRVAHANLCGPDNRNLHLILEQTRVIVEVPPPGTLSDIVTIRGPVNMVDQIVAMLEKKIGRPLEIVFDSSKVPQKEQSGMQSRQLINCEFGWNK
jgi:hypothetical protein